MPILLYGKEAWFSGRPRPSVTDPNRTVRSGIQRILERQFRPLLQGIRAILPASRTTHKAALYRKSGIPPIELLEAQQLRFSIRLQSLDCHNPLAQRAMSPSVPRRQIPWTLRNPSRPQPRRFQSRLQRTAAIALKIAEVPHPLLPKGRTR